MLKNLSRKERLKLNLLKVGEVAKRCGVLRSTVDFYADIGFLKIDEYMQGGYRLFSKDAVLAQMARIKELKNRGLKLDKIKRELG